MNYAAIIERHAGDTVALVSPNGPTTYGELRRQVDGLRGGLAGLGIGPGDRVALCCTNDVVFVAGWLAALGVGAAVVPLNPSAPPAELEKELTATGARLAIVSGGQPSFAKIDRGAVRLEHVLSADGAGIEGAQPIEPFFDHAPVPIVERDAGDPAALMFTSGTSGFPKAAVLSHGNLLANLEQSMAHPGRAVRPTDVGFGVLPLFHIFGLNVVLGMVLYAGASVVLAERFEPTEALALLREHRITVVAGAPPMFVAWLTTPDAPREAFASVRLAASGAAKLPEAVARAFEDRFGVQLSEGYGLTEASPIVTTSAGATPRYGSIGVPLPGVEVRLVDAGGDDVLEGDPGEIWVRGPNVFSGYLDDPAATAQALTPDGWLMTGDVAVADGDGYLWIVDRSKDLIIVSGFNVYPAEVEEVLGTHPDVAEATVVGVTHPRSGEAVKAFVVPRPGHELDERQVIEHCAAHLARYKCPSTVVFVEAIPKGLGGKALRRELR